MTKTEVISIDGGAATGCSSNAQAQEKFFNIKRLETGAAYRLYALLALNSAIDVNDPDKTVDFALDISPKIRLGFGEQYFDGAAYSTELRAPAVSKATSKIARYQPLRELAVEAKLHELVKSLDGQADTLVLSDGRDEYRLWSKLGRIAFGVYQEASIEKRAWRRLAQESSGAAIDEHVIQQAIVDIAERDLREYSRSISPLLPIAYRKRFTIAPGMSLTDRPVIDHLKRHGQFVLDTGALSIASTAAYTRKLILEYHKNRP